MSDLKRTLADLAERGTPVGSERLRDRVTLDLASDSSSTPWSRVDTRRPTVLVMAAVAVTLLLVGALPLLLGPLGGDEIASVPPVPDVGDGQTVSVTVSGVSGRAGDEMAGVLYEGGELIDLDADALGGFWTVVEGDDFTATEVVREPGTVGVGRFPFVSDEALTVEPGMYTLVVWVDDALNPASRWVPVNTDGRGLFGCHVVFEVGDDARTDVFVSANLQPDGWNINCTTGVAIPGTDAAAAVAPSRSSSAMSMQWNPILAQTTARQAPPSATCPPGSNPDALGPADQPRPRGAAWSNQAGVFDQHAGRIIFIDEMGDTWTFDVCSNTWDKANPALVLSDSQSWFNNLVPTDPMLVYDVDSDVTIAFYNDALAVYDYRANTWTQRSKPASYGAGAIYDPISGLVVLLTAENGLIAYDVETDEWIPVGKIGEGEYQAYLIGHIADTDRIGFLRPTTDHPRRTSEELDDEGMVVDSRTGEPEGLSAPGDGVFAAFGRLSYATGTSTPVVEVEGEGICRLDPATLDWTCVSLADGPDSDGGGLIGAIVGDPINDRIVLIYGYGSGFDGKRYYDVNDIWAIDFETGEWTQLLQQTGEMTYR